MTVRNFEGSGSNMVKDLSELDLQGSVHFLIKAVHKMDFVRNLCENHHKPLCEISGT